MAAIKLTESVGDFGKYYDVCYKLTGTANDQPIGELDASDDCCSSTTTDTGTTTTTDTPTTTPVEGFEYVQCLDGITIIRSVIVPSMLVDYQGWCYRANGNISVGAVVTVTPLVGSSCDDCDNILTTTLVPTTPIPTTTPADHYYWPVYEECGGGGTIYYDNSAGSTQFIKKAGVCYEFQGEWAWLNNPDNTPNSVDATTCEECDAATTTPAPTTTTTASGTTRIYSRCEEVFPPQGVQAFNSTSPVIKDLAGVCYEFSYSTELQGFTVWPISEEFVDCFNCNADVPLTTHPGFPTYRDCARQGENSYHEIRTNLSAPHPKVVLYNGACYYKNYVSYYPYDVSEVIDAGVETCEECVSITTTTIAGPFPEYINCVSPFDKIYLDKIRGAVVSKRDGSTRDCYVFTSNYEVSPSSVIIPSNDDFVSCSECQTAYFRYVSCELPATHIWVDSYIGLFIKYADACYGLLSEEVVAGGPIVSPIEAVADCDGCGPLELDTAADCAFVDNLTHSLENQIQRNGSANNDFIQLRADLNDSSIATDASSAGASVQNREGLSFARCDLGRVVHKVDTSGVTGTINMRIYGSSTIAGRKFVILYTTAAEPAVTNPHYDMPSWTVLGFVIPDPPASFYEIQTDSLPRHANLRVGVMVIEDYEDDMASLNGQTFSNNNKYRLNNVTVFECP